MKADHWLYRIIPAERSDANLLTWLPWAFFGNDPDGIFGENNAGWYAQYGNTPSFGLFARWWLRNPAVNLRYSVINWPRKDACYLFSWLSGRGWEWWFWGPQIRWVDDTIRPRRNQAALILWPPYVTYKGNKIEAYFGWGDAEGHGWFGAALRQADAPDAGEIQ